MNILFDGRDITVVGGVGRFVAQCANAMARRGHRFFCFSSAPEQAGHCFPLKKIAVSLAYLSAISAAQKYPRTCPQGIEENSEKIFAIAAKARNAAARQRVA